MYEKVRGSGKKQPNTVASKRSSSTGEKSEAFMRGKRRSISMSRCLKTHDS